MNGKRVKTVSANERVRRGYVPWEQSKADKKSISVSALTHFYHRPFQDDWGDAHKKAQERKWNL